MNKENNKPTEIFVERRKFVRLTFNYSIKHCLNTKDDYITSKTDNISMGGIKFFSERKYDINDIIKLIINFSKCPSDNIPPLNAKIVWTQPTHEDPNEYLVGVEFIDLSKEQEDYLSNVIEILQKS